MIFPEEKQASRWGYLKYTSDKINELRENTGCPHLIHVPLDRYAASLHQANCRSLASEAKEYGNIEWWRKLTSGQQRQIENQGHTQRKQSQSPDHDVVIKEMMGET